MQHLRSLGLHAKVTCESQRMTVLQEGACDSANTWVKPGSPDSPMEYEMQPPPSTIQDAWPAPQDPMDCSPVVFAFLGSLFDPVRIQALHH